MTNTLYFATKAWDSDPDNITTKLAVAEISSQDWQDFESEQQLLRRSKALKFCFNDFRFDFLNAQELDSVQEQWQQQILNKMDVQDYVLISKQEYDYAQSLPKLKMLTNFTQLYRDEIRGYGATDYTGEVVYTENVNYKRGLKLKQS